MDKQSETYKAEIMALWRSQGMALDEIRIRIFDSMPLWAQRDIVEEVRREVAKTSSAIQSEPRAIIV
ncbi:MAG: hypothetical protein SGI77_19585 [Pirellulaceae bacterium]|nr:hypothetical protein [Pirellulaceae bacterium]